MANRIKGITVEINGNTTGLQKSLQAVDKNIHNTQTQLKDVEKLLKLDPTNTELLAQKQKLLGDAVKSTKERLDTLKKASEKAAKTKDNYDAWKAKYDPLKQKIGETETQLNDLKEQAKNADEQLAKGEISQEKYGALQREIKETTDELSGLKQQAKDVSDEFGNPISPEQYDALQREIVETEHELQNLQTEAEKSHTALVKLGEAGETLEKVGGKISTVGTNLTKYVTVPVLGLGTAAVKTTTDFDASMSKVAAVSGATGEDFDALRAKAREMGSQTKFSASEAADFYMSKKYPLFRFKLNEYKWNSNLVDATAKIGFPICLQLIVVSFGLTFIQRAVNNFGKTMTASFTVGQRIEMYLNLPCTAFQTTLATYTGQNIGAGNTERVKTGVRQTLIISLIMTFIISAVIWIFAGNIITLFNLSEQAAEYCLAHLRVIALINIVLSMYIPIFGVFQGSNHSGLPMIVATAALGMRVLVTYLFRYSKFLGHTIIWWNGIFGFGMGFIITWSCYPSGVWKKNLSISAREEH